MNKKEELLEKQTQERNVAIVCIAVTMMIIAVCARKFFGLL